MQEASFNGNIQANTQVAAQNGQINNTSINGQQTQSAQTTSIFSKNAQAQVDVSQSNTNSGGTGGLGNIFMGGGVIPAGMDNTSIFSGFNRGSQYALYSKKDANYDDVFYEVSFPDALEIIKPVAVDINNAGT